MDQVKSRSLFVCFIGLQLTSIAVGNGSQEVLFNDVNIWMDMHCQSCFNYWLNEMDGSVSNFGFYWRWIGELDSQGDACCLMSCDGNGVCDGRGIAGFPPNMIIDTVVNKSGSYTFMRGPFSFRNSINPSCGQGSGGSGDCVFLESDTGVINNNTQFVLPGGTKILVPGGFVYQLIRINNWPFVTTSTGVVMRIGIGTKRIITREFVDRPLGDMGILSDNIIGRGVRINANSRSSDVAIFGFSSDGSGTRIPVGIVGPLQHEYDPDDRYFDIFFGGKSDQYTVLVVMRENDQEASVGASVNDQGNLILSVLLLTIALLCESGDFW